MDIHGLSAVGLALLTAIIASADATTERIKFQPEDDFYVAAVVDYHPEGDPPWDSADKVLGANVANYEAFVEEASNRGADIVVFPEYGLTQIWPVNNRVEMTKYAQAVPPEPKLDNEDAVVPCLSPNVSWVIQRISCSARANHIYVVINTPEVVPCELQDEDCPSDGIFIYNSNIAFDRFGAVISKYHKYHLFLESSINRPHEATHSMFTTNFNVTFGMFTCFDILFKEPAFDLAKTENITDMIFTTAWFSELPFLTAVQFQATWSLGLGVNLLASEYNEPEIGCGGSGIYSGIKGALSAYIPSDTESHLLVAKVPKISAKRSGRSETEISYETEAQIQPTTQVHTSFTSLEPKHEDLSLYSRSAVLREGVAEATVCHGDFCCKIYADIEIGDVNSSNSTYRFVVYDGIRSHGSGVYHTGMQICAILHCLGDDFATCGSLPKNSSNSEPIIRSLRISGNFNSSQMVLPNTLNFELKPFPPNSFNFTKNAEKIQFASKYHLEGVLTFSIYGRNFQADS